MDAANPLRSIAPTVDADVLLVLARTHRAVSGATVARLGGRSYARTRACLHRLVAHGLVTAEDAGSAVMYRLNRDHVLAGPVERVVATPAVVEEWLAGRLSQWAPRPCAAVLFGSWARAEAGPESDIDVLLVHQAADDEPWGGAAHETGRELERVTGNAVQFLTLDTTQLARGVADGEPLIASLRQDGRVLLGPPVLDLLAPA